MNLDAQRVGAAHQSGLRDVGAMPAKIEPVPINALLQQISGLEPEKIDVIARTLGQASVFNEVVRKEISGMEIAERSGQGRIRAT